MKTLALPAPHPNRTRIHRQKMQDQTVLENAPKVGWNIHFYWPGKTKGINLHIVSLFWENWDSGEAESSTTNCIVAETTPKKALRKAIALARKEAPELHDAELITHHVSKLKNLRP